MEYCKILVIVMCLINRNEARNIALKKKATQSTTRSPAGNAVDGNRANELSEGSCSHTTPHNTTVWWQVDLEDTYTITTIVMSYRKGFARRLAGFSVYVSNSTDWSEGQMCFNDTSTHLIDVTKILNFVCTKFQYGRYVTIYNERLAGIKYPDFYNKVHGAILELCEVEIYDPAPCLHCNKATSGFCDYTSNQFKCTHGCDPGFFGVDCTKNCSTSCGGNGSCDVHSGVCRECEDRFYRSGTDCINCSSSCGGDRKCDIDTGKCMLCNESTYISGVSCISCPVNCKGAWNTCFTTNGTCVKGCDDYFHGLKCENKCPVNCKICVNNHNCTECKLGYSGYVCTDNCTNCLGRQCNLNGSCISGCNHGFYGDKCKQRCTETCRTSQCYRESGSCSEGCRPPMYGQYCNMTCPANCGGQRKECSQMSGTCIVCDIGLFDELCTSNCSTRCGGTGSCDVKTGACDSCDDGWIGSVCEIELQAQAQTRSNNGVAAAIGGGSSAIVIVIILVIIGIVIIRRRSQYEDQVNHYKHEEEHITNKDEIYLNVNFDGMENHTSPVDINSSDKTAKYKANHDDENCHIILEDDTYYNVNCARSHGVSINEFHNYVVRKIADESLLKEYQKLPKGALYETLEARKPENKAKNRFKTTFPYDKTRVILKKTDTSTTDYINASFIHGKDKQNNYIASQGPLHNTVEDFWQMVWQCKVGKIVMLTGLFEGGKNKCHKYWPNIHEKLRYGDIVITVIDERCFFYCIVREMNVQHEKIKQSRRIVHFHFTAWPDHDVTNPILLVQFHRRVESKTTDQSGPLLVHCSAGIGRTGTYIGLDHLVYEAKTTELLKVEHYVRQMRECRMTMVQKPPQYVLLHEAILEEIQLPQTVISMSDFIDEWSKILSDERSDNRNKLKMEYEKLHYMRKEYGSSHYKSACSQENKNKNRHGNILALDEHRPFLKYVKGRTDYINAVILPSMTSEKGIIVTHKPMKETVVDFWRLIMDHDVTTIVHFESVIEEKICFYPSNGCNFDIDFFTVKSQSRTEFENGLKENEFRLLSKNCEEERILKLFAIDLGNENIPTNSQVIQTVDLVTNWKRCQNQGPCAVVSIDGRTSCDIFCAVMNVMESMRLDNEIDIFQTVRFFQMRRPEFIADYDHYKRCYETIHQYLMSETVYFN